MSVAPIVAPILLALRVITLDQAVTTAEQHQPQLAQAAAQTAAARARVDEARAPLLPQVSLGASARVGGDFSTDPGTSYDLGLNGSWLLWDFGQSSGRLDAARAGLEAQTDTGQQAAQGVILNVRLAYFTASADKALLGVARDARDNQQKHLDQIEKFVGVGTRPEIDLAQARTDVANAELVLVRAQNAYDTARAQLSVAMGLSGVPDFDVDTAALPEVTGEDGAPDELMAAALRARPEAQAMEAQLRAQSLGLEATSKGLYPSVRLATSAGSTGPFDDFTPTWTASLTLSWTLFDGGLTHARTDEAQAGLALLRAQKDALEQQIRLEVEQARLGVRGAMGEVHAATLALASAKEQLRLAEGRYTSGVGNVIELGDAQVAVTQAAGQRIQADFDLAAARAQLLKALGSPV